MLLQSLHLSQPDHVAAMIIAAHTAVAHMNPVPCRDPMFVAGRHEKVRTAQYGIPSCFFNREPTRGKLIIILILN